MSLYWHRDLGEAGILIPAEVDDFFMQQLGRFLAVEVFDKALDTALVAEFLIFRHPFAFVAQGDLHARVEEGLLTQPRLDDVVVEHGLFKNPVVRPERTESPCASVSPAQVKGSITLP